jgi:DNA-binding beta-propeller fold protein YncE
VNKIEPKTGEIELTVEVGHNPIDLAFDGPHVWVTNWGSANAVKLRRATGTVQKVYPTENNPAGVLFDGTSIWIANSDSDTVTKISP